MDKDFEKKMMPVLGNVAMAYSEVVNGDIPIVWIHGMGSYRETFHPLLANPPVKGRHLAIDLPGFGESGHLARRHTLQDYVNAVIAFLDGIHLPRAVLVGHSFGGMVVGEVASSYPERIDGVILISAAGYFDPENALSPTPWFWINRMGLWITGMEFFGRRMMMALGVDASQLSADDRRRFQFGWRHAYEMARMGSFYHSRDLVSRLQSSHRPFAAIHGSRDVLFPLPRVRAALGDAIPLWVLDGAGHVPFYSHPAPFTEAFREAFSYVWADPHSDTR